MESFNEINGFVEQYQWNCLRKLAEKDRFSARKPA
jgi:hypothetical protein